jgi:heterodisulfide reductase subunit A
MECASCLLEELVDAVLHHPRIEVLTCAELERLAGSFGQFRATIQVRPRGVDAELCYGCPECIEVCPVTVPNELDGGLSARRAIYVPYAGAVPNVPAVDPAGCLRAQGEPCDACARACPFGAVQLDQPAARVTREIGAVIVATGGELSDFAADPAWRGDLPGVYTTMQLERMLDSSGPTGGQVPLPDGDTPATVALVHCAGGAGGRRAASCSAVCCMAMSKYIRQLPDKLPRVHLIELLWERSTPGKGYLEFSSGAEGLGDRLERVRLRAGDRIALAARDSSRARGERGVAIHISSDGGRAQTIIADMVVLASPLRAAPGSEELAHVLGARTDQQGFIEQPEPHLAPYLSTIQGIHVAGCASGPKDISASVTEGAAAAARVLASLVPGRKLDLVPTRATVDEQRCGGCKSCVAACPFGAVELVQRVARVDERLCRGCGSCAARCPSGALAALGFTDDELFAEVTGALALDTRY